MKEAKLLCKIRSGFRITDVTPEITLLYNAEQYISEAIARRSKQLQQAARAGAVELTWVERFQMKKPESLQNVPPWLRNRGKAHVAQKAEPVKQAPEPQDTIEGMVAKAAESLDRLTKDRLDSLQGQIERAVAEALAKQAEQTERMLREMVTRSPQAVSVLSVPMQPSVEMDFTPEEKFIPSSLSLSGVGKINVNVAAEETSVSSVDEALEVLKKKRGKKHE